MRLSRPSIFVRIDPIVFYFSLVEFPITFFDMLGIVRNFVLLDMSRAYMFDTLVPAYLLLYI